MKELGAEAGETGSVRSVFGRTCFGNNVQTKVNLEKKYLKRDDFMSN